MAKRQTPPTGPHKSPLQGPPHNNHGLFSDHYLDETLPGRPDWRLSGQADDVAAALASLRAIFRSFKFPAKEAQTEDGFIKPVLEALGHTTLEVQPPLSNPGTATQPDYVFYLDRSMRDANRGKTLTEGLLAGRAYAVGDAKYWDRPLDVSKVSGDFHTNQNPSFQIDHYIRYTGLPWGILTNGRLWRLYHKDSSKYLDRYYEVDLPTLLEGGDPARFMYFYAFFGRRAFDGWDLGVDAMLRGSNDYARGVGDSLKVQVFDALRHLAQGFLDRQQNKLQPDPPTLKAIYDASLIILYRLLFILYAEARDLLPLHASEAYKRSYSLDTIKREIKHGNPLLATTPILWGRLTTLFQIIDSGSPEMSVPTYNGGLFDAERNPFVAAHTVGDYHLQQAIDKLARVAGQFVDFRDLQVRHLGTIYEGLLEYHLQPIKPAGGWSIDLLNDRGERKATGSYYTPDYIVSYMVEQTLTPILEQAVEGVQGDAAKAQAILEVNVLDMAMGSAHFLVEATEYIARFLVGLGVPPPDAQGEAELNYWRRRVAQACIYGVDLNPLAVDLAKLAIWLITVAKDRPLSFLDHHFRVGNALIGERFAALQAVPEEVGKKPKKPKKQVAPAATGQLSFLYDDEFRQTMGRVVASMWQIEGSDAETVADIKEQENLYADLRARLTGVYGGLANVLTARHFGLEADTNRMALLASLARGYQPPYPLVKELAMLDQANTLAEGRRFFHWELEFPEVFFDRQGKPLGKAAGFDAILGNPPYIRQEGLAADKPYLAAAFPEAYHGVADLSIYFFAQALALLRPGGRTSFINSNSWLRANYATSLRAVLRTTATVERLIDLGDNRVFADAPDVYPAIHVFTRDEPPANHVARTAVFVRGEGIQDFDRQLAEKEIPTTIHDQHDSGWQLCSTASRTVFAKLMGTGHPLGKVVGGRLYRGVLTGLNEAFIVDQATRDQLVATDPACAAVIKPILRGEDLRPWYQEDEGRWLLFTRRGIDIEAYPAIKAHLEQFREQLEPQPPDYVGPPDWPGRKSGTYKWFELQDTIDYYREFDQPKLFWPDITKFPRFSLNENRALVNDKGFIVPSPTPALLGVLQSRAAWYCVTKLCVPLGERNASVRYQQKKQFIARLPIPVITEDEQQMLATLATNITSAARERYDLHRRTRHRFQTDLGSAGKGLNQKLTAWWALDFPAFRAEVKKVWKREIPPKERGDWEMFLAEGRAKHQRLTADIVSAETELNARVYALYSLTPDEIKIVEESTTYQYGEV